MEFSISSRAQTSLAKVDTKIFVEKEKEKREAIAVSSLSSSSLKELADQKKVATAIPMILHNDWSRAAPTPPSDSAAAAAAPSSDPAVPKSLEEEAAQALMAEVSVQEAERLAALKKKPLPILMANAVPGAEKLTSETDRFRHDVRMRPDDMTLAGYEERSVEDFGIGLLMGMGWKEGQGIGGKNRRVVNAVEFVPRGHLLGLGADPALPPPPDKKKINKPGEKEVVAMRVAPDEEGKIRHFKTVHDRLIPVASLTMRVGALLEVVSGTHSGLFGRAVDVGDLQVEEARRVITVKLNINEERVQVKRYDVQVLDPHALPPGHAALTVGPPPKAANASLAPSQQRRDENSRKRPKPEVVHSSGSDSEDSSDNESRSKKKKKSKTANPSSSSKPMWVQPNLHVRIISKSVGKGAFYNQKGVVVDIVSRSRFIVKMDESGRLVEDLKPKHVETVLPKAAGRIAQGSAGASWPVKVMVLALSRSDSEHGLGVLLEKGGGKALVQLDQDMELVTVPFERVCEYIQ